MTYDGGRSLDDLPLAAYGGSGMELTAEDESKLEAEPAEAELEAPEQAATQPPATSTEPAPGAFAHAVPGGALPDDNFGAGRPAAGGGVLSVLAPLATRAVTLLRTSRPAQGAAFGGVIVVGLLLLVSGGPNPSAASAQASPTAAPVVVATREPGNATLQVTGKIDATLSLDAMSGTGLPNAPIAVTWTDATANSLALEGAPDRGTRATDERLVLSFTVLVEDQPVTFTSTDGECAIGMALNPTGVSGSFSCRKLESDDGKYTVGATGTYRT